MLQRNMGMMPARWLVLTLLAVFSVGVSAGGVLAQDPAQPNAGVDWVVSMILPEVQPLDPARLVAALQKRVTEKDRFNGHEEGKGVVLLHIAGGTAVVSLMPKAIPGGELQEVCRVAWQWPQACDTVKDHKAHVLVVLMGTRLSKVESALVQTKIVAALLEETNAVAAYWGTNLNSREMFLQESTNVARGLTPTVLWIGYRVSRDASDRFSLSTHGLKDFGLMEIEVKDANKPFTELFNLVEGTAAYLITKGPVIRDGDTIGHTNEQRIRVRHGESYWRQGTRVYRVMFER